MRSLSEGGREIVIQNLQNKHCQKQKVWYQSKNYLEGRETTFTIVYKVSEANASSE